MKGQGTVADRYDAIHRDFRWQVPARFNIAEVCCARWARQTPEAVAIRCEHDNGARLRVSYGQLHRQANRAANLLRALGVRRGDRVAIVLPQRIETAVANMAVYTIGAVAMPLSMLFGVDALAYRLRDSEAVCAIVDGTALAAVIAARAECPALAHLVAVGAGEMPGVVDWADALRAQGEHCVAADTMADDPAVLIYTSGTTGPPKGALMPQRALIGNLSGFVCSQNWFGFGEVEHASSKRDGPLSLRKGERGMGGVGSPARGRQETRSVFWSPADWAWTGGLMDALLPTLYFGREIIGFTGRFDPVKAFEVMERYRVTHTFLFPTALKAMMKAVPAPRERYTLALRAIMSAGEAVGDAVFAYCERALGITVNEMFGQTEMNYIVGNCGRSLDGRGRSAAGWPARAGSMGRPYPGHRVAVIDDQGRECPPGTPGDVAVHRRDIHGDPDPVFFLGYWRNDEATRKKFTGDPGDSWCRTGDTAVMDDDGYLWYQGRSDDMFKAAGYRIGPSEVENCLVKHPAVANAAVVPKPDADRGALVKAFVVLAEGVRGSAELVAELQAHVRGKLAPYEYPKEIEFINALPMTTTGKVQRAVLRQLEAQRAERE
ncbi:MAG: Acetyl-coenzyme A synthetase [Burkholderiaceae bacterium]|nr:Acetyl-coenzyme A synthetase [Burkholderiaceae bacterium]